MLLRAFGPPLRQMFGDLRRPDSHTHDDGDYQLWLDYHHDLAKAWRGADTVEFTLPMPLGTRLCSDSRYSALECPRVPGRRFGSRIRALICQRGFQH